MAEERVVLQVKFDQLRNAGAIGPALHKTRSTQQESVTATLVRDTTDSTKKNWKDDPAFSSINDLLNRTKKSRDRINRTLNRDGGDDSGGVPPVVGKVVAAGIGTALKATVGALGGPIGAILVAALADTKINELLQRFRESMASVNEELNRMIENARQFSGRVGAALAREEINVRQAQRREANVLSPDLAELIGARSELTVAVMEIKTAFVSVLLPAALPSIKLVAQVAGLLGDIISIMNDLKLLQPQKLLEELIQMVLKDFKLKFAPEIIADLLRQIRDRLPTARDRVDFEKEIDKFLDPLEFLSGVTAKGRRG